jgi:hypothetical protein
MRKNFKLLGAVAVAGLVATTGSAFTAGNTIAASSAGSGTTAISPYATSDVQYNANATTPTDLDSVKFTLDKTARYVALRTKNTGTWVKSNDLRLTTGTVNSCTSTGGLGITWTCDVTGLSETVAAADNVSIVATN